jgi:uncharacterized protein (DUF433 family)
LLTARAAGRLPVRHIAACDNEDGSNMKHFELITVDPAPMGGVPCVRGLRIPVATVLRLLAGGWSEEKILAEYPDCSGPAIFGSACGMQRPLPWNPSFLSRNLREIPG